MNEPHVVFEGQLTIDVLVTAFVTVLVTVVVPKTVVTAVIVLSVGEMVR